MALINVNRSNPDVFYRYKMPRLVAKVEGKGNGIRTVISNMTEIGKALMRPPTYPTKYFGCELGAQTQFDVKRDRYIVNGAHEGDKLQDLLDGFIKKFVLCPECDNPETVLSVHAKSGNISQKCQACGYAGKLDMRHKLTTFILKNPPDLPPDGAAKGQKKKESTGDDDGDSPDENGTGTEGGAPVADGEPILTNNTYDDEDKIDWGEDTSEEAAQRRRLEELSAAAASMTVSADIEKTPQERADLFFLFVKNKKAECGDATLAPSYRAIAAEAERLELKDKAVLILAELLLTADILRDLKSHRNLFLCFTVNNDKAQKYLLGAIEKLVGVEFSKQLLEKTAIVFKCLYDLDLVDEETFLEWDKKVSKKYVSKDVATKIHEKAKPFIKWLKEAEEEEESSDEDTAPDHLEDGDEDADVEVAFTHSEKVGLHDVKPAVNGNGVSAAAEDDDDDIDLDDI